MRSDPMSEVRIESGRSMELMERCFRIRRAVFIEGQGVDEDIEIDGMDLYSEHFLLMLDGEPIATSRVRGEGDRVRIERFAVLKEHRLKGYGRALMERIMSFCEAADAQEITIGSQVKVKEFYKGFGFKERGNTYLDADIVHVELFRR